MDTGDLEARLHEAEAQLRESKEGRHYAVAVVVQRESELNYANAVLRRSIERVGDGHISRDRVDQHRTAMLTAEAALKAARTQVVQAEAAINAVIARTERLTRVHHSDLCRARKLDTV